MGGSEITEVLRAYTIQRNTGFDHGVLHKVIGGVAEIAPGVTTRDTLALAPKVTGRCS